MTWGNADFFFLDSDNASVDSAALTVQRQWLKARLSGSTAQWKFGVWHHPPYSGGSHGSQPFMQWGADFQGLTAIITGHDHIYERLDAGFGVTQFITGIGGYSIYSLATPPLSNSLFRYNATYGALKVIATTSGVQFDFRTIGPAGGELIDSYTVGTPPSPDVPTGTDTWSLPVRPGQTLRLSTRTPESPGPLRNTADPVIQLLDASGTIVASDAGSAGDGINASLTYSIPLLPGAPVETPGWTVRVVNESNGSGEYELLVTDPAEEAYQAWAALQLAGWPAQPEADPDFDGLPSLMEYLLESNPALAATPIASALGLSSGSPPVLQIHLPGAWTRPVTAYLQSSTQLDGGTWTTLARKTAGVGPWLGDGEELPKAAPAGGYTFTPPSGPRQFYRLAFMLN